MNSRVLPSQFPLRRFGKCSSPPFLRLSSSVLLPLRSYRLNLARLVNNGQLPPRSKESMLIFGAIFLVLAGVKLIAKNSGGRLGKYGVWIPSGCV